MEFLGTVHMPSDDASNNNNDNNNNNGNNNNNNNDDGGSASRQGRERSIVVEVDDVRFNDQLYKFKNEARLGSHLQAKIMKHSTCICMHRDTMGKIL